MKRVEVNEEVIANDTEVTAEQAVPDGNEREEVNENGE